MPWFAATLTLLASAFLLGCAGTRYADAEVRVYEQFTLPDQVAADRHLRESRYAIGVDTQAAIAFLEDLERRPLVHQVGMEPPVGTENQALVLKPANDSGDYWVVTFTRDRRTGEPIMLWYRGSPRILRVSSDTLPDGTERVVDQTESSVIYPPSFQVAHWTAERVQMWDAMLAHSR